MKNHGAPVTLMILFLAIIFCVPLSQAIIDVTLEEEERPLVLSLFQREEATPEQPPEGSPQSWLSQLQGRVSGLLPPEEHLREFEKLLEQSSFYEQRLRPFFQYARYVAVGELGEKATKGLGSWYFFTPGVRYLTERYFDDLAAEEHHDPVEVIVDFRDQLRARGIQLLVIPIPGKASVYPDRLVAEAAPRLEVSAHTTRFRERLNKHGVEVFNLHQVFLEARGRPGEGGTPQAQAKGEGVPLYMKTDTHWTGDGARLAAAAVAEQIKRKPWFTQLERKQLYKRRRVALERRGDVLRMTQIPRQEELFSPEPTRCFQVSRIEGGTLFEEPERPDQAPILVLGDSFSRVFQTDEPQAAGWIANLAFELQQPIASIVNDGGASTLVRQELARAPELLKGKHLVIWAFIERDLRFGLLGWQQIKL